MAYATRTASRSSRNSSNFDHSKGDGFRMTAIIAGIKDGKTKKDGDSCTVTVRDLESVNGKKMNQTVVMAFNGNIDHIAPASAKIGDRVKFFGKIDGGTILVLGPWTASSYDRKPASRGRQQARGRSRR